MPARTSGVQISIKRAGHRTGVKTERVLFGLSNADKVAHPNAVGQVNYKKMAFLVYRDEQGLFLEATDEGRLLGAPLERWSLR